MDAASRYLERHAEGHRLIGEGTPQHLGYCVVIPAYSESGLHHSLDSLLRTRPAGKDVEILVVINWPEHSTPAVRELNRIPLP